LPSLTSWLQQYLPLPPCMTYRWTPYSSFLIKILVLGFFIDAWI
jgi:hypothetical protein